MSLGAWERVKITKQDAARYGLRIVDVFQHRRSGHRLLHIKHVTRGSRQYKTTGMWSLFSDTHRLANKGYYGVRCTRPPVKWANIALRILSKRKPPRTQGGTP